MRFRYPRLLRSLSAAAVPLALATCGEPTAPGPALDVSLLATVLDRGIAETPDGPVMWCDVTVKAVAAGAGNAAWQDATFRWFYGTDRSTPVDSQSVSPAEVHIGWGAEAIQAGAAQQSGWVFSAGAPFDVELEFRFVPDGSERPLTTRSRFTCGVEAPRSGVAPPTLSQVQVTPSAGEVERGDTITVTWTAGSEFGLWASTVVFTGAFDGRHVVAEHLARNATHSVRFPVPAGSRQWIPLTVTLYTTDAAVQHTARSIPTDVQYRDRTPPVLHTARLPFGGLAGQFAVGEPMGVTVAASDDNALAWLVYELGAPANVRDSVAAPPGSLQSNDWWTIPLRAQAEWVGAPVLSMFVRDAAGNVSDTIRTAPDSVRVYPVVQRPASAPLTLPWEWTGDLNEVLHDERRGRVYMDRPRSAEITVLDPAAMVLLPPIVLPDTVAGMDLTPGGDSLLVALPGRRAIAIVDLAQPSAPAVVIPLTVLDSAGTEHSAVTPHPTSVRAAANGKALVALSYGTRSGAKLVVVDLASGTQELRVDAGTTGMFPFGHPGRFGRTPDHRRVVIAGAWDCLRSYLAATDAFTACAEAPATNSHRMSFDAAGTRLTYGSQVLDIDFTPLRRAEPFEGQYPQAALSADGTLAYLAAKEGVTVMRVADGQLLERWPLPLTAEQLLVSPDGRWLLAFQVSYGDRVVRVDLP